jgi:predicted negative regulator of RcsB-dependent stress response
MSEIKQVRHQTENELMVERAKDFWTKNGRTIMIVCITIIVLGGAYLIYKYMIKEPKEVKAHDAIFKAEQYFQQDSLKQALMGDGQYPGFEKIINQYSGTEAANLAKYYAGAAYLKLGENAKAAKYLSDFHTNAKQIQARAYKLEGDAYANLGKNAEALSAYKKAGHEYEEDDANSSEYLFMAAYFADRVLNDKKQAIDLYKEVKKKYPNTQFGFEADKYLAQAGVYNTD